MLRFKIKDFELAGRLGVLYTKSGAIETPAFFPVIDPIRQEVTIEDIKEVGFKQVITNAYLLYKRSGGQAQDVHSLLGFDGVVMTDSGAYQLLEYGEISVDQDTIIDFESKIGSDIAVILDHPTGDVSRKRAVESVRDTLTNARKALERLDVENDKTIWVLPIQGGKYLDLVELSAKESSSLPYPMYGIGSPSVFMERYRYDIVVKMVGTAKRLLPPERPVHLFGAGHPLVFPLAVALGVDTFDSASYVLYARDDRYMTDYGTVRLKDLQYFPCSCPVCRKYTPKDLMEMPPEQRRRLLAIHNLYVIKRAIERVKQAIAEGRLWDLIVETSRYRPEMPRAVRSLSVFYRYMESFTPTSKGGLKGVRLVGIESVWNPRVMRFRSLVLTKYAPPKGKRLVLVPLRSSKGCQEVRPREPDVHYIFYAPYLGLVPVDLCGLYPSAQFNYAEPVPYEVVRDLINFVRAFVARARASSWSLEAVSTRSKAWSLEVGRELERLGIKVTWRD